MYVAAECVVWSEATEDKLVDTVGYLVRGDGQQVVTKCGGVRTSNSIYESSRRIQVLVLLPDNKFDFVPWSKLFHYYVDDNGERINVQHHISKVRYTEEELKALGGT